MRHWTALWWSRRRVWLPAVAFLALNLALLFGYQVMVGARVTLRESDLQQQRRQLATLQSRRLQLEQAVAEGRRTAGAIDSLYRERFGTQAGRLTAAMARVKQLARDAGLAGMETISYPQDQLAEYGVEKKSFVFAAVGNYHQLRQFINLLELSEAFLTLEEVRVSQGDGGRLQFQIRLSTLFARDDAWREDA
ncbi:MAG TPA: hypothetical protein VMT16_09395 [Thermoanaerobaculia bacterium]|nr:hypothetical protein [Thermoanaerobaculia bacterium]